MKSITGRNFKLTLKVGGREQKVADFSTPYQFNAKELDAVTGLYNYGARYYDPGLSIWMGVDPLADKFAGWSPYNYTLNNPINMIDPDGKAPTTVKPNSAAALRAIRGTLSASDAKFVKLDANGNISRNILNLNSSSRSANFQRLSQLVNDDQVFEVNVSGGFDYKDASGNVHSESFGDIYQGDPSDSGSFSPNTGEQGFLGITQTPGQEEGKMNSVDGNVHISINEGLSESGRAQNFAHEGLGHGYLYSKGEDHMHRVKSTRQGFKETNEALKTNIINAVQETRDHLKTGNN